MKEFISKWSNWWILEPKRKQLDEAFEKELNELIEREVALRIHDVVGRSEQLVCDRPKIKWKTTLPCYKCDGKGCYKCKQQTNCLQRFAALRQCGLSSTDLNLKTNLI